MYALTDATLTLTLALLAVSAPVNEEQRLAGGHDDCYHQQS